MAPRKKAAANRKGAASRPTKGRSGSPKPKPKSGTTRKTASISGNREMTVTSRDGKPHSYQTWDPFTGKVSGSGKFPLG